MDMILSAWAEDAACAAAVLVARTSVCEVRGVSKRRLSPVLEREIPDGVRRIHIVGVGLGEDVNSTVVALQKLKQRNLVVIWYSDREPPVGIDLSLFSKTVIGLRDGSLARAVAARDDISEQERFLCGLATSAHGDHRALIQSAMSRYRRLGDVSAFADVVRHLATSQSLRRQDHQAIAEFATFGHRELRGHSVQMEKVRDTIRTVGLEGHCRVLITGETGTGKETAAYLIHRQSERRDEPFWTFNCADLSPQLLESRLFGHEKGAFTGALTQRKGAFEQADKGTLFLDEVGELSLEAQAGLLRVLQEQRFRRLGGDTEIRVDVRILSATNRCVREMVTAGNFREDLFYRLSTVELRMPTLRERPEDLAEIANDYRYRRGLAPLAQRQLKVLQGHAWPGNIRELQNILERGIIFKTTDYARFTGRREADVDDNTLEGVAARHVAAVYRETGSLARAAKELDVSINTVRRYLKLRRGHADGQSFEV